MNGQAILSSQADGIKLEGPSAGRSQSFEKYEAEDRPLDIADFEVKVEGEIGGLIVVACPERQMPLDQSRSDKTGKILVHFDSAVCSACRLNTRCPVKTGSRVSTLSIDEASYAGLPVRCTQTGAARHHQYMENGEYRKRCAIRAGAEATVSEMVRAHGMRRSRHRTEGGTRLQLIFAAIACNVKRFIRHGILYGYAVAAQTAGSHTFSFVRRFFTYFLPLVLQKFSFPAKNCIFQFSNEQKTVFSID